MMRAEDFLTLARDLAEAGSEAAHRSAVSRAYYGAFHTAKGLLEDAGIGLPDTAEAHRKIQFCFKESGERQGRAAGAQLEILRDQRNLADYSLRDHRFLQKASSGKGLALAQQIVEAMEALRSEPVWSRFRASVRTYAAQTLRLLVT